KCVELPVEVIMMRGVAPSPRAGIELRQPVIEKATALTQPGPSAALRKQDREHVRDRPLLADDAAIHVAFAKARLGVDQDAPLSLPRRERDAQGLAGAVPDGKARPSCRGDPKVSGADYLCEHPLKQPFHSLLPLPSTQHAPCFDINCRSTASAKA